MLGNLRRTKNAAPLSGQWIGYADGTNQGLTTFELDDCGEELRGHAYLFEGFEAPGSLVPISIRNSPTSVNIEVPVYPFDPRTSRVLGQPEFAQLFPEFAFPTTAKIGLKLTGGKLQANWQTDIGTGGYSNLKASRADRKSEYNADPKVGSWADFKNRVSSIEPHRYMFRGQSVTARLRTSFHRTHRKDLLTFLNQDIQQAHRVLTAQTKHVFRLNDPQENGAFWNLLQHHGYPTPLLDWTMSPFVAAFFSYRHGLHRRSNEQNIRIFMFDRAQWQADFSQLQSATLLPPHFSILEALTIENARALPQQALSSVTNIDDIEDYISIKEKESGNNYLDVFDLPFSERQLVMRELSLMGITAGSLFPGLDGACEELRGRFFAPVR
jgi:FRG domain